MRVILLGAGEHACVVAEAATAAGWTVLASLDHAGEASLDGLQAQAPDARLHLAIGANDVRLAAAARLGTRPWTALVHPRAIVSPSAVISPGAFIGAGAVVQAGAVIGVHAVINSGAVVEHDCRLGACCHVAPGAVLGGGVEVGDGVLIGLGARVRDHVRIGERATVGMGAAVVADVVAGRTVLGVPARERP